MLTLLTKNRTKRTKHQRREKERGTVLLRVNKGGVLATARGLSSPSRFLGNASSLWLQPQVGRWDELFRLIPAQKFHYSDINFNECNTKYPLTSTGKGERRKQNGMTINNSLQEESNTNCLCGGGSSTFLGTEDLRLGKKAPSFYI